MNTKDEKLFADITDLNWSTTEVVKLAVKGLSREEDPTENLEHLVKVVHGVLQYERMLTAATYGAEYFAVDDTLLASARDLVIKYVASVWVKPDGESA
jgi:hypothetical protein